MADHITDEIRSQPAVWRRAVVTLGQVRPLLPIAGERVALAGCGTSFYVAQAIAARREAAGQGETDAFCASEMPPYRRYDRVVAISRSGTTTEVVRMLDALSGRVPTLAISALAASPVAERASRSIILDFADEKSVVQTRFATTTLALLRAHLGDDVEQAARDAQRTLDSPLPVDAASFQHFVFLGTSWTVGLAGEAALKMRETSGAWAESYPAMEYRHGPISVASATTLVWALGDMPSDLLDDVRATGATVVGDIGDPMAELVMVQRAAAARARALGRDPDRPVHLSRSVILG